jgi:hypothetical protein
MWSGDRSAFGAEGTGRIITTMIVWLLLGAIVNVAVAWGFGAPIRGITSAKVPPSLSQTELDRLWEQYGDPVVKRELNGWRDRGIVTSVLWFGNNMPVYGAIQLGGSCMDVLVVDSGFPFRCMSYSEVNAPFYLGFRNRGNRGVEWIRQATPLWPGFAINTVFYAGLLWLLFAAPFALRRRRRIKRGLCPKCAYPVGASDVCTECGAAVPLSLRGARERARVREPNV